MICLDANIIIYIANKTIDESTIIASSPIYYSSVVRIETLGFANITSSEERRIRYLLDSFTELPLSDAITEQAIVLRQEKKMGLGDAIIAATALDAQCELWTANSKDFEHIYGLQLHNPLA